MIEEIIGTNLASLVFVWMISLLMGIVWAWNRKVFAGLIILGAIFLAVLIAISINEGIVTCISWDYTPGFIIGGFTAELIGGIGEELYNRVVK